MTFPLDATTVRAYMDLSTDGTSKYSDTTIGSNIRTAVAQLERKTGRKLADVTATLTFSTDGATSIVIPGLRTATSVTRQGATLVAGSTYFLQPDAQQTGVFTGIAFRGYSRPDDYRSNPEWFDRGLDSPFYQRNYARGGLPNDLVITGSWGYSTQPDESLMAVKILTAYLTKLADTNEAGFISTPGGGAFDLNSWPIDVVSFVEDWSILGRVASVPVAGGWW